jgi:hypothetical protein
MAKSKHEGRQLSESLSYKGKIYTPQSTDVPDELHDIDLERIAAKQKAAEAAAADSVETEGDEAMPKKRGKK